MIEQAICRRTASLPLSHRARWSISFIPSETADASIAQESINMRILWSTLLAASLVGCLASDPQDRPGSPEASSPSDRDSAASLEGGLAIAEHVFGTPDPDAEIAKLTDSDRRKLEAVTTPASLEVSEARVGPPMASFVGCYGWHQVFSRKALLGNTLYTYWQSTFVCVNGSVTSVWLDDVGGETSTPGWRIDEAPETSTKNVGWEGRGNARYHFVLGAGGVDVQKPTDCIQQRLNADGVHHRSMASCDLAAP
jgi:hypothetical protein